MMAKLQRSGIFLQKILPLLLLSLGAALRLAALGSVPAGMHQDEALTAWNAFALLHEGIDSAGNRFPVYIAGWGDGQSAMAAWLLIPILAVTGGHVTPFLARLPQAIVSVFTLWAVYCIMKRLFGRKAGLWGLFLLAVCPWHIMMSRWGLDANFAPGFLMFGFYFFVRAVDNKKFLPLAGLFYGFSLYCYAVVWPIVPFILILQIVYCLYHKKIRPDIWSLSGALILFVMALPLMLFLLVNSDVIPQINLPFLTIPKMIGYRGSEVAKSLPQMWKNLRNSMTLLWHQNTGSPYDILLPWGLFYDIGRVFTAIGVIALLVRLVSSVRRKTFAVEYLLFAQLAGGALNCLLINAKMHQVNTLFIPLVLSQAYGVWTVTEFLHRTPSPKSKLWGNGASLGLAAIYMLCLLLFQRDYYTDYSKLVGAYFAEGLKECVDFAWEQCGEKDITIITAEKGAQWTRLLLYTETLPSEYLATVIYDVPPAPASFETKGIHINTRIHYDAISQESIYIIYYTDVPVFEKEFTLTKFHDWYVAVPGNESAD